MNGTVALVLFVAGAAWVFGRLVGRRRYVEAGGWALLRGVVLGLAFHLRP